MTYFWEIMDGDKKNMEWHLGVTAEQLIARKLALSTSIWSSLNSNPRRRGPQFKQWYWHRIWCYVDATSTDSTSKLPNLICVNGDESRPQGVDYDMIQVKLADMTPYGNQACKVPQRHNVMMDEQLDAQWAVLYLNMLPVVLSSKQKMGNWQCNIVLPRRRT